MRYALLQGDALARLRELPDERVQCIVTSPPYWGLRDYGVRPDGPGSDAGRICPQTGGRLPESAPCAPCGWNLLAQSRKHLCGYWGDANARKDNCPSKADTNGWTTGFCMNTRPAISGPFRQWNALVGNLRKAAMKYLSVCSGI